MRYLGNSCGDRLRCRRFADVPCGDSKRQGDRTPFSRPMVRRGMMLRAGSRTAIHASVWGLIAILTIAAATPADARRHASSHRGHSARSHAHHGGGYSPPYSAIVVDANSGATLHESSPDGIRHPASLTKIMTLYLLFEQL